MASGPITSWPIDGEMAETMADFIFLGSKITADVTAAMKLKTLAPWKKSYDQPRQHIKKQRHHSADQGPHSKSYGVSSSHVLMWELYHKEDWVPKNWCFWIVVLEKTLESPLDGQEIQPVHSEDQPWDFFGRNDAKAETPVLWPPHAKSWLIGKYSDAGRDLGQEKGTTEDEMAGWHHWLDGRESEWTPGVGDGQGGLACCDSWGCKESDTTERLNCTELSFFGWQYCVFCHSDVSGGQWVPWDHDYG